ncbi:glycosyltransferase family 4 protein [Myroides odoratimimus]|uniref:glycosyltransferase family 4 protein n=1 Tax=Myroides odoratimimus TaxID=76832 RepID=UPI0026DF40FF|nr:glycosyltransferase family 4 protein [Myroides odoratimimus]MDO5858121.1 glycosyltransferase family 4 protein [Myroides odoratimimus]
MNYNFLIIGYFGLKTDQIDGQTIKTQSIHKLIKENFRDSKVDIFDTESLKYNKSEILVLFFKIIKSKNIILIPGKNNLDKAFNIISDICFSLKKSLYLFAVGGWLPEYVCENIAKRDRFKRVKQIFVESFSMKKRLSDLDLFNVEVFPNFRVLSDLENLDHNNVDARFDIKNDEFRIVFCARVCKEKGYDYLFDLLAYYNSNVSMFSKKIVIDFYGPLDSKDQVDFFDKLAKYDAARYLGVLSPNTIHSYLINYDVCILPSNYEGEGFPGTIIDAYLSGIPVVVSKWKDLPEFVKEGYSGYVFNLENEMELFEVVQNLANNDSLLKELKENCVEYRKRFSDDTALRILESHIN